MPYYRKHEGNLFPGKIALSEDIHFIQQNIDDAIRALIEDQYDHSAFILGSRENAFLISPAPKQNGRYVDAQNLVDSSSIDWVDIDTFGYKQAINMTKTSVYSFIVRLRNDYSKPQDVVFELQSDDGVIGRQVITMAAKTLDAEYEVVFNLEHFSTQHGLSPEDIKRSNIHNIPNTDEENFKGQEYENPNNPDNHSLGVKTLYLVVKAIHKATEIISSEGTDEELITEDTFQICIDTKGQYGQRLERTGDDKNYESTEYDLFFKTIYSNAPTYLCTGGEAVVHGSPVICNDTHVTVDGASSGGNTKSYIVMDEWGQLSSYTSDAYWGDEPEPIVNFPAGDLVIAIIYTYNADTKQPKIIQDDNLIEKYVNQQTQMEEYAIAVRQRSHHERIRRLEKEMAYQRDITIPSRLKYNLTGEDVVDKESKSDNANIVVSELNNPDLLNPGTVTEAQKAVDWSKYFISTDQYGNFVVKSVDAETEQIPVTLKETATLEGKSGIQLAQTIVSSENVTIDRENGIATLAQHSTETPKNAETTYKVGLTAKEAKETEFNPWDDNAGNRPETKDIKPTERIFTTKKGVNGVNVRSSEYPAMTLYVKDSITLKELTLPVVKFKNVETVQFHIWKRQGPNNQHNTVWLEKLIYSSQKFSLKNAKTKNGYQILDEPFKIAPKNGLKLDSHQYIILVQIVPKSGDGSVYIETYTPKSSTDFLIRYHGSADCAHFRLKERYREIWYTSATTQAKIKAYVNEYYTEGTIESGEIVWENSEPIVSVTPSLSASVPTGCSVEIQANVGNGWKTLTNGQATNITGGTSSFRWRAILKGTKKATPKIQYDAKNQYAIHFSITKDKPHAGSLGTASQINDKNVLTTKTFYPGDILAKYIGDSNLNTCNKFSNYEWLRIYGNDNGVAKATIDIMGSDKRIKLTTDSSNKISVSEVTDNISCSPKNSNEYDLFTLYYADLTFDDFVSESVDYSNYDASIEYDEHNLRFKIDTDKAYNDDDVAIFNTREAQFYVDDRDESKVDTTAGTDENAPITRNPNQDYITIHFKNQPIADNEIYNQNGFIWKKTLPGDSTLDLTNYSALKIGYNFTDDNADGKSSQLDGIALYISSAVEEEAPDYGSGSVEEDIKQALNKKTIERYENVLPLTLESNELEAYKDKILCIERTLNNVIYHEYYYYSPDENNIWRRHQYHNVQSFVLYKLGTLDSSKATSQADNKSNYITISIDKENDNFKYVKEIGLVYIGKTDNESGINIIGNSDFQVTDIKGVVQGYNTIYSAEKAFKSPIENTNIINSKLYQDGSGQISSITRIYYNRLSTTAGTQIGYINNGTITKDANNFAIQFVSDTYIPKDSLFIKLCAEENGVSPVFSLNMPTLNHVFYDKNLELSNLLDTTNETGNIYKVDTTKDDYHSTTTITADTSKKYTVSATPTAAKNLPDGKKETDYSQKKDNKIEYKISIEPVNTTLNIAQDKLEFNVYKQKVTIDSKTSKETYGTKSLIGKIRKDSDGKTKVIPDLQVQIDDKVLSYTGDNPMAFDSTQIGRYGFILDYATGQYKIKIGFQGYSVIVDDSTDTEHNKKMVTYRSAETEFTVNMYWRMTNTVNFAQIFKKINEDTEIKSISIETSEKFGEYMNTVRGTKATDDSANMHIFIKDMTLYEAEHIPLLHPNVRMKIYSKAHDGQKTDVEAVGIRKVGAVIEYK